MKTNFCTRLALAACIGSLLFLGASCSKKTVIPPGPGSGTGSSTLNDGTNIDYPISQDGYSEENLPTEGTLDDSTGPGSEMAGGYGDVNIEQQSDEYKQLHGRSSINLEPIYFAFDQAGVKPSMTDVIIRNADYINSVPSQMVVLEGNSDERGTGEYNLALGERRAINTQQYLINLGVDPRRIRTLSYGEEKPLFFSQDEEAYSLNRRVDFVLQ